MISKNPADQKLTNLTKVKMHNNFLYCHERKWLDVHGGNCWVFVNIIVESIF